MIRSFADDRTEAFFLEGKCPAQWKGVAKVAARKLDMVDAAVRLTDLRSPPGNRLERLKRTGPVSGASVLTTSGAFASGSRMERPTMLKSPITIEEVIL